MVSRAVPPAGKPASLSGLAVLAAACLGGLASTGCSWWPLGGSSRQWPGSGWAAVALVRAEDPAKAASEAAWSIRQQLGSAEVGAVLVFDSYGPIASPSRVASAVAGVFAQARIVGCSTAGVATGQASGPDRAVALLAIAGQNRRFSAAHVPGSMNSAEQAAAELLRQLDPPDGPSVVILLASPATLTASGWDPQRLLGGLSPPGRAPAEGVVFGGLAGPAGDSSGPGGKAVRLYLGNRAFADGLVALQVSGQVDGVCQVGHELLRVGPVWRPGQIRGHAVGQLDSSGDSLPAQQAIARHLIAQDRHEGHIGRLVGNHAIPLRFYPAEGGAVRLAAPVQPRDRLVLLKPGPPEGRIQIIRQALGRTAAGGFTLLALPDDSGAGDGAELDRVRRELAAAGQAHPVALAFLTAGQFAPVTGPDESASDVAPPGPAAWFHQHTVAVLRANP